MNTVTIPKNKYVEILNTQEKLRTDLSHLQKVVSSLVEDEVSSEYIVKLSKIEQGLSLGRSIKLKTKSDIKKFFISI